MHATNAVFAAAVRSALPSNFLDQPTQPHSTRVLRSAPVPDQLHRKWFDIDRRREEPQPCAAELLRHAPRQCGDQIALSHDGRRDQKMRHPRRDSALQAMLGQHVIDDARPVPGTRDQQVIERCVNLQAQAATRYASFGA